MAKAESDGLDNACDNHGMRGYCFCNCYGTKGKRDNCKTGEGCDEGYGV